MLNFGTVVLGDSASIGDSNVSNVSNVCDTISSITQDLYQFVSKIQKPKLNDQLWLQTVQIRCEELADRVALARKSMSDRQRSLTVSLENISNTLQAYVKELDGSPNAVRLRRNFRSLSCAYEDLAIQARRMQSKNLGRPNHHSPLKPANFVRNIFHVLMGAVGFVTYQFLLNYQQAMVVLAVMLTVGVLLEVTRRIYPRWNDFLMEYVFRAISRPREYNHINSATYYLTAITLITALCPKPAVLIGVLVLALADPAAALAGKKWGVKKLWKEKTYVGTSAFFGVAVLTSLAYLIFSRFPFRVGAMLMLSVCVATLGTLGELFSGYFDDNFTIPVLCAGVASFWF